MSQITWTYIDDDGSRHKVGLFHGDNTGHLLVYCNTRIVVIDFGVTTSKNYSFFINEELCDIEVEEKEGKFSYGFKIDQITDTPRNRGRRRMIRNQVRQSVVIGIVFLILILIVVYFVLKF
jgi:predicted nucleic acid-binding Zn ribbon protein